ncbi:hypothetical protein [Reinekea sp. G2M2-21]|uniref:hypothetical protein n=1 Tax=Reinekea sp. G2M2-21 TaxID=2788942 RepID=UPI0018AB3E55|nr:hypothetical protein [Reinekea sp. G2M2-21]
MPKLTARTIHGSGFVGRVIVDLHLSNTFKDVNRKLRLISRVYSVKDKRQSKSWRLAGHSSRLLMSNVQFPVSEAGRQAVLRDQSKTPHAYIDGTVEEHAISDESHTEIIQDMVRAGGVYVAYDPYKVEKFCVTDSEHLPMDPADCESLQRINAASRIYAYEHGAIAIHEAGPRDLFS